jgi:hypothetical protein
MKIKEEGAKHEKTESKPFEKKEDKGLKDALGQKPPKSNNPFNGIKGKFPLV